MSDPFDQAFQLHPDRFFSSQEQNRPFIQTPLLAPYAPIIPPELKDDPEFYKKVHIPFTAKNIFLVSLVLIFSLWIISINTLVLIALLRKRQVHPLNYYLVNLNVMDIIVGFLVVPFMGLVVIIGYFPFGKPMCHVLVLVDYLLIVASGVGNFVLMLNYVWIVRFPGRYNMSITFKNHIGVIILVWVVALFFWIPPFLNNLTVDYPHGVCGYNTHYNTYYTICLGIIGFLLPLFASIGCVIYSFHILRKKIHDRLFYAVPLKVEKLSSPISRKRLWSQGVIFETNSVLESQALARRHFPVILGMLALLVASRVIFYFYFTIGAFMSHIFSQNFSNGLYWIMHSTAGLAPILHIVFDQELRFEIRRLFCRKNASADVQIIHQASPKSEIRNDA